MKEFDQLVAAVVRYVRKVAEPPPPPAKVQFVQVSEGYIMALKVKADFAAPVVDDVDVRHLGVVVNDAPEVLHVLAADAVSHEFLVPKESTVKVRLRDTDKAGNVGAWSDVTEAVAHDTFAPPVPGAVSLTVVAEVPDAPVNP